MRLVFNDIVRAGTAKIYDKLKNSIPDLEWPILAPYIFEINKIKKENNFTILAHNYQTPDIFYGIADVVGDSLGLAIKGSEVKEKNILMCGVHFMAETAKIMSPEKRVFLPDMRAGCSLAESITAEDVRNLKKKYPGVPVVTYVNTSADVKSETDVCCTSANAVKVVESLGVEEVIFLPDEYLAKYVSLNTKVKIISWKGKCEVHEKFSKKDILEIKSNYKDLEVVSHPECPPDVIAVSDFTGSTSSMINHVKNTNAKNIFLVTECSMSDNVQVENPNINFIKPCNLCPHMKKIELPKILDSLKNFKNEIKINDGIAKKAKAAITKMIEVGR